MGVEFDLAENRVERPGLHDRGDLVGIGALRLRDRGEQNVGGIITVNGIGALVVVILVLVFLQERLRGGQRAVVLAEGKVNVRRGRAHRVDERLVEAAVAGGKRNGQALLPQLNQQRPALAVHAAPEKALRPGALDHGNIGAEIAFVLADAGEDGHRAAPRFEGLLHLGGQAFAVGTLVMEDGNLGQL